MSTPVSTDRPWRNRIVGQGVKPASQFVANARNWREHPRAQRAALQGALNEVGWIAPVVENIRTGHLVDGHERVWQALQNGDADVPFVQVDLSDEEEAYALLTLDPIGAMAQASKEQLGALLAEVQSSEAGVRALLEELAREAVDEQYTRKVETPLYEPSGPKPDISELYDDERTRQLERDIDLAEGLSEEERAFLRIAAQRHTELHFDRIANYYAHASPEMQRLMEDNALVNETEKYRKR